MQNVTLNPIHKQLFQVHTENSHPRLTLRRVLYAKFLRWVDKTPPRDIIRRFLHVLIALSVPPVVMAPQFFLGILYSGLSWNSYAPAKVLIVVISLTYAMTVYRLSKRLMARLRMRRAKKANQYTYEGLPVDELASFLMEEKAFKKEVAIPRFGLSQPKYFKIANELEHYKILVRGDSNARVLNDSITREVLVRQLRENFPLRFNDGQWAEYRGSYELFLKDKERREQREQETIERKERKVERMNKAIDKKKEELSAFDKVLALSYSA